MPTNIYRVLHAILSSPELVERLAKRYAYLLNVETTTAVIQTRDRLNRIAATQSKPHKTTLQKLSSSWKDEMKDDRSISEISIWMMLPYDHNLLTPYYDSKKS